MSFNMQKKFKHIEGPSTGVEVPKQTRNYGGVEVPADLPDHFFDPETGDLDLRRVTGRDAYNYFKKIGIRLPIMPNMGPPSKPKPKE